MRTSLDTRLAILKPQLERAVDRICPFWLRAQRDDLVQAALLRLERQLTNSGEMMDFPAYYLKKVAHSCLVDEIRKRRSRREHSFDQDDAMADTVQEKGTSLADPLREVRSAELGEAIRACLGDLLERRRLAVLLHLQGHSFPEAAGILGRSVKSVENLVYRGLDDLRRCLVRKGLAP